MSYDHWKTTEPDPYPEGRDDLRVITRTSHACIAGADCRHDKSWIVVARLSDGTEQILESSIVVSLGTYRHYDCPDPRLKGHYPDVRARVWEEDWRTSDSPEAAAERARFEKEQGQ